MLREASGNETTGNESSDRAGKGMHTTGEEGGDEETSER